MRLHAASLACVKGESVVEAVTRVSCYAQRPLSATACVLPSGVCEEASGLAAEGVARSERLAHLTFEFTLTAKREARCV